MTLNGHLVFEEKQSLDKIPQSPCFSTYTEGEIVEANLGDSPFVFDIVSHSKKFKKQKISSKKKVVSQINEYVSQEHNERKITIAGYSRREKKKCSIF